MTRASSLAGEDATRESDAKPTTIRLFNYSDEFIATEAGQRSMFELPDWCDHCGACIGPWTANRRSNLAHYVCPWCSYRWTAKWTCGNGVADWLAYEPATVQTFVEPVPIARTVDGRPVFDSNHSKEPHTKASLIRAMSHTAASVKMRPPRPGEVRHGPPDEDET